MDVQTLLRSLREHKVKFLLIGAWALPAYGHARMTRDVDIFIDPTEENARRVITALKSLGYTGLAALSRDTILRTKILLRQYVLNVDIHPFVRGITFARAWKNRIRTNVKGVAVFVPSLNDMIRMKKAAGRAKDNLDLIVLRRIKALTSKRSSAR